MLCYHALNYYFVLPVQNSEKLVSPHYLLLTDLCLVIRRSLANTKSIIPSSLDGLLIRIIRVVMQECEKDAVQKSDQIDDMLLFLGELYKCLHALVLRCELKCEIIQYSIIIIIIIINIIINIIIIIYYYHYHFTITDVSPRDH